MRLSCIKPRRAIRRIFLKTRLSAKQSEHLWQHLKHCAECRQHFETCMKAERLLESRGTDLHTPSALEFTAFEERVIDASKAQDDVKTRPGWRQMFGKLAKHLRGSSL